MNESASSYSDAECREELDRLFPRGPAGPDVLEELAPAGWETSPLVAVFHPSVEQVYEETARIHRNLQSLKKAGQPATPEPTLAEIAKEYRPTPIETEREVRELMGMCLWDVFSDNHDVVAPDGRILDLGSFRASGGFLAEWINDHVGRREYVYLGTIWVADRADLTPVYELIFRRLKKRDLDWKYAFPQLHLIDFRPLREALDKDRGNEWEDYDPEKAWAKEKEAKRHDEEVARMRETIEEGNREAMAAARHNPPPKTVVAYQNVYGRLPEGWPPGSGE